MSGVIEHNDMHDANFPTDAEGRTYHLNTRIGSKDIANRLILVGSAGRARTISTMFDSVDFEMLSDRGFHTFTGSVKGLPITVMAIGMGFPMMDFAVREARACVKGPMVVVRLGTCGILREDVELGSLLVAGEGSILVQRNPSAFAAAEKDSAESPVKKRRTSARQNAAAEQQPHYYVSSVFPSHPALSADLCASLDHEVVQYNATSGGKPIGVVSGLNATACSFYSSQGRQDSSFTDGNQTLIADIKKQHPSALSMEMETFQLLHLAASHNDSEARGYIHASAVAIGIAHRMTNEFLAKNVVQDLEKVAARAVIDTLVKQTL